MKQCSQLHEWGPAEQSLNYDLGPAEKAIQAVVWLKTPTCPHLLTRLKDEMEACDTETNSHILFLIFSLEIELKLKQQ